MIDFDRIATKTGVSLAAAQSTAINEAARMVIQETPVKTGRLRASWFFSPSFPTVAKAPNAVDISPTAGGSILARLANDGTGAKDGALYFLNGANYASIVNARNNFVDRVVARGKTIEAATIRKIRLIQGRT